MQKPKVIDGATPGLEFQDSSTEAALDGTIVRAGFQNDNFGNLYDVIEKAGYTLIDDDLSQIHKALRGLYVATYTYNTSVIATQTVNDIVLGSDGLYYEAQADAISGDNPVGSVTGNWEVIYPQIAISSTTEAQAGTNDAKAISPLKLYEVFTGAGTNWDGVDIGGGETLYPNGDIVGSNANGEYIKYANGELVCRDNVAGASGGFTWTFPFAFTVAPVVTATCSVASMYMVVSYSTTTTQTTLKVNYHDGGNTNSGAYAVANGRWK